jgi:hypothetical protein
MDAVVKGLIGGTAISLIIFFGGLISLTTGFGEFMSNPKTIGLWLIGLTAITAGQLFITFNIIAALSVATPGTDTSTSQ